MRIAISQPEHFPYRGFFDKVAAVDLFVLLDCVAFQGKGSFQARNWFHNTQGRKEWFTLHLPRGTHGLRIDEVPLLDGDVWRTRYARKLEHNLGARLPFDPRELLDTDRLVDVNVRGTELCCQALGIQTPMIRSSTLAVTGKKSVRVANICRALGASTYVSGPGARAYLDPSAFGDIALEFFTPRVPDYQTTLAHLEPT